MSVRLSKRIVHKAVNYTVSPYYDQSGTIFTNLNAAGNVDFVLPPPSRQLVGCEYEFLPVVAHRLRVLGAAGGQLVPSGYTEGVTSVEVTPTSDPAGGNIRVFCDGVKWRAVIGGVGWRIDGDAETMPSYGDLFGLIGAGPDAGLAKAITALTAGVKIAGGQHTTASATDTVVTGLATVVSVVVSLETDPADANLFVSAQLGNQADAPVAGSIVIKTWKSADGSDPTPVAASAFTKKVNWIAIGT